MTYEVLPVEINTPQWLKLRKQGIGGSDCAVALGLSSYRTPYQLYLDKLGLSDATEESEAMYWGKVHESAIIAKYCQINGVSNIETPKAIYRSIKYPFMQFTPDAINGKRIVQAKTSRYGKGFGEVGTDEIPQEYTLQCQHEMAVFGGEVCDVPVLIGGSEYRQYEVPADKEIQEAIIEEEHNFWRLVVNKIEPEVKELEDIKRKYKFSNGKAIECVENILHVLNELKNLKTAIKEQESIKESLESQIKLFMADNEVLECLGTPVATWKTTKAGTKFNIDMFKEAYPDLYTEFLTETSPQRRFLIK